MLKWYSKLYHFFEMATCSPEGLCEAGLCPRSLRSLTQSGLPPIVPKGFTLDPLTPRPKGSGRAQTQEALTLHVQGYMASLSVNGSRSATTPLAFLMLPAAIDLTRTPLHASACNKTIVKLMPDNFPRGRASSFVAGVWGAPHATT